ncbi:hypothetical protein [Tsuneonella rigui]|uniref:hypothetical protein n=1 Tax=Tsuneonella rigui TaxID=1708790 RepID=UPI000F7F2A8E|nr:hypothetical protein [Tsuneonella rigui]
MSVLPFRAAIAAAMLAGASGAVAGEPAETLKERACPAELAVAATCYGGQDRHGAWLLAAVPKDWNRALVVHAHGGPRLGKPKADDSDEDLVRFRAMVGAGYAWIGSTYRRGGYGVRMAAEDVDQSRKVFWKQFGQPRLTILHGQSWGGNVATKTSELYAISPAGETHFDGVLITNGVLFGGTGAYGFRADLRAVYQYYCNNLPRPDEAQFPLWQGTAKGSTWTRAEVGRRLDECTGASLPAGRRSPEQAQRLAAITGVTGIAAENLESHLEWATFTFADLVQKRLGGLNPFDNRKTVYRGSPDDAALNRGVVRFTADQRAIDRLAYDADLTGLIAVPTLTVHYRDDPTVSSTADAEYAAKVAAAGKSHLLTQFLTAEGTHSRLSAPDYLAPLEALVSWVQGGAKPAPASVIARCRALEGSLAQKCTLIDPAAAP